MTERDAPVYCPQCGSIAYPDDNFCGVCGSAIPPDAPDATPTQTVPTQVHALPNIPTRGSNLSLLIGLGFAAVLVLGVGIGTVAALTLLRSEPENQGRAAPPPATTQQEDAAADKRAATQEVQEVREETNSKPAEGQGTGAVNPAENDAKKREREPTPEEASGSRPGYNLVQTPDGGLTVEVLQSWGVETGADSEGEGGTNSWSYYAGEYLTSSITTASNLDAWYSSGDVSGAYVVASKELAQRYTDDELIHSLLFKGKAERCTPGPYEDYNRAPYSGKIQTWYDCGVDNAISYTLAAAPEGRECVVVLDARAVGSADREDVQHLLDSFEVNCGRVTSEELPSPTESASSSAAASSTGNPSDLI